MTCLHCDRSPHARGLCNRHYKVVLRAEKPKAPRPRPDLEQLRAAGAKGRATQAARHAARAEERLGDLTELLAWGEWPPRAVARLDWSMNAAIKAAERKGRTDITGALYPYRKEFA